MNTPSSQFQSARKQAIQANHRLVYTIDAAPGSCQSWLEPLLQIFENKTVVELSDTPSHLGVVTLDYHRGAAFLGSEIDLLLVDLRSGFDANSFNALCGCLRGGGVLLFYNTSYLSASYGDQWLIRALAQLPQLLPPYADLITNPVIESTSNPEHAYAEQRVAIDDIIKVAIGRSKRPLVLTADRGRGKTSALGLAVAELFLQHRVSNILICAPLLSSVESAFYHAHNRLPNAEYVRGKLQYSDCRFNFIAPDALLAAYPECDLLLVDEAAAIPVPTLIQIAQHYSRIVFSSTQNGYEGCGRGFSLKFVDWLAAYSPALRHRHLFEPIRWAVNDPLERWTDDTFLIKAQVDTIDPVSVDVVDLSYRRVTKAELFNDIKFTSSIFSILINAHYQTSINDLFSLLNQDAISVVVVFFNERVIGCAMLVREGELDEVTTSLISSGERRPKGHLVPVTLINQLDAIEFAPLSCERIMRIAIHPKFFRKGIGSALINYIYASSSADYLATSFGLTHDLHDFWYRSQFVAVKLGSKRDHVSGTYSALYLRSKSIDFISNLHKQFCLQFPFIIQSQFPYIDPSVVRQLLCHHHAFLAPFSLSIDHIKRYILGGSNYESVEATIRLCIQCYPSNNAFLSDLVIVKLLQNRSWSDCSQRFGLSGKRNVETLFRHELGLWVRNLQCKRES
jgi:tRNA(Met) cytidine acetyltransferase